MNERNTLCSSNQIYDSSNGQQIQTHLGLDPCILMPNTPNYPPSHMNQVLPSSAANMNNFDHLNRPAFFGMTQYNNQTTHPTTNLELGIPNGSNFFDLPGPRVFPVPLNNGFVDHSASSSNYRCNSVSFGEYGRSNFPTEDIRGLCKRKNAGFGSSAGPSSSSSAVPMDPSLGLHEYRGNNGHSMMEGHRSGGVGLHLDSGMLHNYNYLPQGNYGAQSSYPPSSCTWLEQQGINNGGLQWNGPPMLPYFQGSNIHGGTSDLRNNVLPGYPEPSNNHGYTNFLPTPPILQQHHNLHPSQNVRGYGVAGYPAFISGPTTIPTNDSVQHDLFVPLSPESVETTSRPTGYRIYRSHGRGISPDTVVRRRDLPRLRNMQADRVAILEFPNMYEVDFDEFNDNHREMRLDIDDMSYEELLALSERIGTVNTGLSEKDITSNLKTKLYNPTTAAINLEELPCMDQNNDSCIICQDEYEEREQLGTLECGHEYHANCLKQWLLVKNVCPICKSPAITKKDR